MHYAKPLATCTVTTSEALLANNLRKPVSIGRLLLVALPPLTRHLSAPTDIPTPSLALPMGAAEPTSPRKRVEAMRILQKPLCLGTLNSTIKVQTPAGGVWHRTLKVFSEYR